MRVARAVTIWTTFAAVRRYGLDVQENGLPIDTAVNSKGDRGLQRKRCWRGTQGED
jgi:hypothetical protein